MNRVGVEIKKISVFLPKNQVTNDDIVQFMPGWNSKKISQKLGIEKRYIADPEQTSLDLAVEVCLKIKNEINFDLIDGLILCTQSPDYILPTSACILQDKIGLNKTTACFDFNLGCSGYIYGLAIAKGLITSNILNNVLFVTSETYSKYIDPKDGSNRALFGDAATVTLLSKSQKESICEFSLGTDGSGFKNLIVENGGARNFKENYKPNLYMNGPEIFSFTNNLIPKLVLDTLKSNNLELNDVDYFIFHQANLYILEQLRIKLEIPKSKFLIDLENTGNTVSNTIPIVLEKILDKPSFVNKTLMLIGFGVGYSWGGTIINT